MAEYFVEMDVSVRIDGVVDAESEVEAEAKAKAQAADWLAEHMPMENESILIDCVQSELV